MSHAVFAAAGAGYQFSEGSFMQTTSNSSIRPGRRALSVFLSFLMVLSAVSVGFVFARRLQAADRIM